MVALEEEYCPNCGEVTEIVKTVPHQADRCTECGEPLASDQ